MNILTMSRPLATQYGHHVEVIELMDDNSFAQILLGRLLALEHSLALVETQCVHSDRSPYVCPADRYGLLGLTEGEDGHTARLPHDVSLRAPIRSAG